MMNPRLKTAFVVVIVVISSFTTLYFSSQPAMGAWSQDNYSVNISPSDNSSATSYNVTNEGNSALWMESGADYLRGSFFFSMNNLFSWNGTVDFRVNGQLDLSMGVGGTYANIGVIYANLTTSSGTYTWSYTYDFTVQGNGMINFAPEWNTTGPDYLESMNVTCTAYSYYFVPLYEPYGLATVSGPGTIGNDSTWQSAGYQHPPYNSALDALYGWSYDYKSVTASFSLPSGTAAYYLNYSVASNLVNATYNGVTQNAAASGSFTGSLSVTSVSFAADFVNSPNDPYTVSYYIAYVTSQSVTFTESGLPAGTKWYLNISGQSSLSSTGTSVSTSLAPGTYSYSIASSSNEYAPTAYTGSFTVGSTSYSGTVTFNEVTYSVTFSESGLSSGTWYTNVSTTSQSLSEPSTTSSLSFSEPNGTYSFTVQTNYKIDKPSISSGSFTISGAAVTETITFSAVTYAVTFTESGLPTGTEWYANVTGQSSLSSTTTTAAISLTNGSYTYSIGTPDKLYENNGGSFTVSGAPLSETVAFTLVVYSVTFTESGLPTGTKWYFNITGQTSLSSATTTIPASLSNATYSYVVATSNKLYAASPSEGSFTINGAAYSDSVTYSLVTYAITFTETGLPAAAKWYVNITSGSSYSSTATSITLPESNGSYTYSIATGDKQYSPSPFSGSFTVNGAPVSESVTFSLVTYTVTFTESGLPASTKWYLNVSGQSSLSSTSTTISVLEANGTYAYSIAAGNKIYNPDPSSGSFTVNGTAVSMPVAFTELIYLVTFRETGLPATATWYVNITSGASHSSATSSLSFNEPNGTYLFTLSTNNKEYEPSPSSSTFTVNGAPFNVSIVFSLVNYNITFRESGLPSGASWYATVNGSKLTSTASSISFLEPNGSYAYSIQNPVNGSYGVRFVPGKSSGNFTVNGAAILVNVSFVDQYYLLVSIQPSSGGSASPLSGWYNSQQQVSLNGTPASSYQFLSWTGTGTGSYSGSFNPETITVKGPINETATFEKLYAVTFTETGLPSGSKWFVNVTGPRSFYSYYGSITFYEPNGSYSYSIGTNPIYAPSSGSGNIVVQGSSVSGNVAFHLVTYSVDFIEIGLPSGAAWYVSLNGTQSASTSNSSISFTMTNGTYPYSISPISGVTVLPSSGNIFVSGGNVVVNVVISPVGSQGGNLVSFIQSGLPSNREWFVTFDGYTESSFSSIIQFYVGSGSYPYSITATGSYAASPNFGNLSVDHNMELTVIFTNSTGSQKVTSITKSIEANPWLYIVIPGGATVVIGWALAVFIHPENRKKWGEKRKARRQKKIERRVKKK